MLDLYLNRRTKMSERIVPQCCDDFPYKNEYYANLLWRENERFLEYQFQARSPQIKFRKGLVKSLSGLNDKLGLGASTFHLSVHLMDMFMDCHEIAQQQLMLTASTCLLISAKYVDIDSNVPRFSHLQLLTNYRNSLPEYGAMEKMLLTFCNWNLNFTTALNFLEHLLIDVSSCAEGLKPQYFNDFRCEALRLINLSLSETDFVSFKPSIIAASCLAATRIRYRLRPVWTVRLEMLCGYPFIVLSDCVRLLMHFDRINHCEIVVETPIHQVPTSRCYDEDLRVDCKCKLKAPAMSYNCAKTKRRQLLNPRDLKQMYCAI